MDATSLVGREQAIDEVAGLAGRPGVRLVTLTGLAGIGKTRLAVAVAKRLAGRFGAGTAFVPLAPVTQPELVLTGVARAVGAGAGRGQVRRWSPSASAPCGPRCSGAWGCWTTASTAAPALANSGHTQQSRAAP